VITMAMHALFDEGRRREIRRGIQLGRFQARKPASEPLPQETGTQRSSSDNGLDSPHYVPLALLDRQLLKAVYGDDLASAQDALSKGANPDVRDASSAHATVIGGAPQSRAWGNTALMIASQKGNLDLVRLLISYNADVNLDFNYGSCPFPTALVYAQKNKHLHVEHELLGAGATR
jgi:hypothetical protein